ncbi:MAG: hypothetical protein RIQ81_656 [Pseudomonadota bacterium]|jgi:prepilin-type N-terminal cleavage/methylation domain-containing protein
MEADHIKVNQKSHGFSLLEVLVAIGLMGILALGIAEIFRQQIFVQDKVRDRGNLEDMRNVVRSVVNCQLPCVANMARIPTNQGRWALTPVCEGPGLKVLVTDSKGKAPVQTGNLFTVNEGYICMYLDEPAAAMPANTASGAPGVTPPTGTSLPNVADQKALEKALDDVLEEFRKHLPEESAAP